MTTENYNLMEMWKAVGGTDERRIPKNEVFRVLQFWYFGSIGEMSAVNKLVKLGAIKKVQ